MAKLKFSQHFDRYPPEMLGRFQPEDVLTANGTTFELKVPDDYDDPPEIQGFTVTYKAASSSQFKYSPGENGVQEAVSGEVASVEVRDAGGALVMKISKIADVDIGDIYAYIVKRPDSPNPDPERVMEFLLRGDDKMLGSKFDDQFASHYNAGDDLILGKDGSDNAEPGAGNDIFDGGGGFDALVYQGTMWTSTALHGAKVDLDGGTAIDPWGGTDVFSNVELVRGSHLADVFTHSGASPYEFMGVIGSQGADTYKLDQQSNVWVIYESDRWDGGHRGIVADLGGVQNRGAEIKGTITDGWGHTDRTVNVRKVEGTERDDSFKGSRLNDHFSGREGTDSFNGGKGIDWVHFDSGDGGSVHIDLSLASGQVVDDGFGNTETLKKIEAIHGSWHDDVIIGNGTKNEILGGGGDDTLTGGNGKDKFIFGNHHGDGFRDTIADFASGKDKLLFDRAYIDDLDAKVRFINGDEATSGKGKSQFFFNDGDHTLYLDVNGKADGGVRQVAVLDGVTSLQKSDILIVEHYIDIV